MTDRSADGSSGALPLSRVVELHRDLTTHQQTVGELHHQVANLYELTDGEPAVETTSRELEGVAAQLQSERERLTRLTEKVEYLKRRVTEDLDGGDDGSPTADEDPFTGEDVLLNTTTDALAAENSDHESDSDEESPAEPAGK